MRKNEKMQKVKKKRVEAAWAGGKRVMVDKGKAKLISSSFVSI